MKAELTRRKVLAGGAMAGGALASQMLAAPANAASTSKAPPVADQDDDKARLTFARSLLGPGRKTLRRRLRIRGTNVDYDTTLGAIELRDEAGTVSAIFVYTAYTRVGVPTTDRPISFAWGGGPSAVSTSFHFGSLGPRRRIKAKDGSDLMVDNDASILDRSDLVLVDPVGTGWSMPAEGFYYDDFYSVAKDGASVAQFIQRYLEESRRNAAPIYLFGHSYGTVRLPNVIHYLGRSGILTAGAIPVASAIDGNAFWESSGNMAAFYLMVPNYAAIAWYHKRQANPLPTVREALQEGAEFALGEYISALMKWPDIPGDQKSRVLNRLYDLTGIRQSVWEKHRLRLNGRLFAGELLKEENKILESGDTRKVNPAPPKDSKSDNNEVISLPVLDYVQNYFRDEMGILNAPSYRPAAPGIIGGLAQREWPVDRRNIYELGAFKVSAFANFLDDIAEAMIANPKMRVQQHSPIYDLTSTSFPGDWSLRNMNIPDELHGNVEIHDYEEGHTIYNTPDGFKNFMDNVSKFYNY